jgi:hypothetical protein
MGVSMNKKASLSDYLSATQLKREDTDAYLRYLTKWQDHHENQMNPNYPVKFAHTRADADVDMEKVAFLGGLARGAGRLVGGGTAMAGRAAAGTSAAAGRVVGGGARMASSVATGGARAAGGVVGGGARMANAAGSAVSGAKNSASQWVANRRQSGAAFRQNLKGAYNQGRHGSVHGNAAAFEAKTLAANPSLGNASRKAFDTIGKPEVVAPPKPLLSSLSEKASGGYNAIRDKAGPRIGGGMDNVRDKFTNMSPNTSKNLGRAAKGAGLAVGAYGTYRAGKAIYDKVKQSRESSEVPNRFNG